MTRYASQARDPAALLKGINEESSLVKYWRLGGVFLAMMAAAHKLRILKTALRLPVCYSTLVMSNLGPLSAIIGDRLPKRDDKYVAGNLTLEGISAAPPRRRHTPLALVIYHYDSRLTFCLGRDPPAISEAATLRFLDLFVEQLRASARVAADSAPGQPGAAPAAAVAG
jgi:hypothetical protein